jgi:hypothetical protein
VLLEQVSSRITNIEERKTDDTLATRINDIEKGIGELKLAPAPGNKDQPTALVGGLESASSADAAKSWLKEAMGKAQIEGVIDIYDKSKGQKFNGMVFVKFASIDNRDVAIQAFNDSKISFTDSRGSSLGSSLGS